MSVLLSTGLADLSRELGENTVKTETARIGHYNDAVIEFFGEKKWPFSIKLDTSITTSTGISSYSITGITDMRQPGGIKLVTIGNNDYLPINYEDRNDERYNTKNWFYLDPEEETLYLKGTPDGGQTINIYYWHIPARATDLVTGSFPLPDRYRKTVAYLAAAYVQWARYLTTLGDAKYNMYLRGVGKTTRHQAERHQGNPRNIKHFLSRIGFRRTYPN